MTRPRNLPHIAAIIEAIKEVLPEAGPRLKLVAVRYKNTNRSWLCGPGKLQGWQIQVPGRARVYVENVGDGIGGDQFWWTIDTYNGGNLGYARRADGFCRRPKTLGNAVRRHKILFELDLRDKAFKV